MMLCLIWVPAVEIAQSDMLGLVLIGGVRVRVVAEVLIALILL
jgi:hypothetical protein